LPKDGRIPFPQEMPDWHKAYGDKNAVIYQRDR
jgi:hypothetical protein